MSDQTLNASKQFLNKTNINLIKPPLLGIDYGSKNFGLAITDSKGIVASPLENIKTKDGNVEKVLMRIQKIINEYQIKTIVLGLPQEFNSVHQKTTKKIMNFKDKLEKLTNMDVLLYDESYSTVNSYSALRELGQKQKKTKKRIDSVASAYFLQELINIKNRKNET
jgi:putative holliday junction resolvase